MAIALTTLTEGTDTTIVSAVSGKIIRVKRVIGGASANFTLKSGSTAVLPGLRSGTNSNVDVAFADAPAVLARGEALVAYNDSPAATDVYVEYDVVD
jgi:hypothetical protein